MWVDGRAPFLPLVLLLLTAWSGVAPRCGVYCDVVCCVVTCGVVMCWWRGGDSGGGGSGGGGGGGGGGGVVGGTAVRCCRVRRGRKTKKRANYYNTKGKKKRRGAGWSLATAVRWAAWDVARVDAAVAAAVGAGYALVLLAEAALLDGM